VKYVIIGLSVPLYTASQNQLPNCILAVQSPSYSFCITVNFYSFNHNNFVATCTEDFDIPVGWDNCRKAFCGHASE
jgi:hypothetical protein